MDDPATEIEGIVRLLTMADTVHAQQRAVETYFTEDAGFQHPLCTVLPAPGSRASILGIYQWYRTLSPTILLDVESSTYNEKEQKIYLNVVQTFHLWFSPFRPTPARLLVRISLREKDKKYYISQQEDFYQPEDIFGLVLPPFILPVALLKRWSTAVCNIGASVHSHISPWLNVGIWRQSRK